MSKLDGEIIKILAENSSPVSSAKLAELLDVSPRTIKRYIKMINEQDAIITSTKNGYLLEVSPVKRESLMYDSKQNFDHFNQDIFYELFIHEFHTIDQISENTYYNRNTVSNALKGIRQVLENYDLELKSESKKGLYIQGSEINIRQCMVENVDIDYYFYQKYKSIDQSFIHQCIIQQLRKNKIIKRSIEIDLLEKYIKVSILREPMLPIEVDLDNISINIKTLSAIEHMISDINMTMDLDLKENLKYYLASVLGGQVLSYSEYQNLEKIVLEALEHIENKYNEDLLTNKKLINNLCQHIKDTCQKLRVNVHVENPLKAVIKSKYYMAYEYATILTEKIHLALNYDFSEDEIAYIALHFEGNNIHKSQVMKRKILIICDNGVGTSVLLKDKIENQIPELDVVDTLPYYMLENYSLDHIDFIISTRSYGEMFSKKVIVVSPLLSEEDLESIHRYMKDTINISYFNHLFNSRHFQYLKAENKRQVLDMLTSKLCKENLINEKKAVDIIERENHFSTEIGHYTAIPHCIVSESSFIYVIVLEKPIIWKNEKVQMVFFGGINPNEEDSKKIFSYINKQLSNPDTVNALRKVNTFDDFKQLL